MSRNFFYVFGIVLISVIFGCKNKESITYVNENEGTENCDNCPQVTINIPKAQPENEITKKINTAINSFVVEVLNYSADKESASSVVDAVSIFKKDYLQLKERFPEDILPWEATVKGTVSFGNEHFSSIEMESYVFTGGAHGYGSVTFLNFDNVTGEKLEVEDFFTDVDAFTKYAEETFRKQEKINPDANINSSGFMFENDAFHLPNSIGFNEQGVLLIYNPYEIAAYADGLTKIEIPYAKAKEFMKPSLRDLVLPRRCTEHSRSGVLSIRRSINAYTKGE